MPALTPHLLKSGPLANQYCQGLLNDVLPTKHTPAGYNESAGDNETFVLQEQGRFLYEVRPKPGLRSTRDVVVKVMVTGLCGSDVR